MSAYECSVATDAPFPATRDHGGLEFGWRWTTTGGPAAGDRPVVGFFLDRPGTGHRAADPT